MRMNHYRSNPAATASPQPPRAAHTRARRSEAAASSPFDTLGPLIHGVAKAWRQELDRRLRPLGLTRVQWQALLVISRAAHGLTQRELADRLDIGAPATVALIDRMEREGFVERTPVPGDRRRNAVRATAASRKLFARIEATAGTLRREILSGMTSAELATLHALLTKAKQRIEAVRA